jgi:peptidoglycan/xylan/chitin deacetylase (PgdA/CDA1 family)
MVNGPRQAVMGVVVALLALGAMAGVVTAASAASPSAVVDDGTTSGTNKFAYSGTWVNCGGCNPAGAYQKAFRYSPNTGAAVTFTFSGTQAVVYGLREPAGGIASARIDGGTAFDVDYYATAQSYAPVVTTPVLPAGTHTVTLTVTGRSSGTSKTISVDKADVYTTGGTTPSPTASPAPSPTATTAPATGGIASLTFDDGQIGQFRNARPVLQTAGMHGTFYIISDGLGWGTQTNMSPTEARQLVADGDEIGNHTRDHSDLATLSSAAVEAEFADSQAVIQDQLGVTPTTCAYPYGSSNATVQAVAAKHFTGCRGTGSGTNTAGSLATYNLRVFYMYSSTTAADVRAAAQSAIASKSWVIFVYHGVGTGGTNEDVSVAGFQAQVQALKDSGISVQTVSQAMTSLGS